MYNQRTNYVTVGLFVTAMLAATVTALVMLTGGTGPRDAYVLIFENVADVKFGTQVRYEGFPIGEVESISPVVDGARMRFRVDVSIDRDWRIPQDSVARITASSFLAAKTIDITSGNSPEIVAIGDEIATASAGDMFGIMATAAAEITDLSRTSISPLLATLNDLVGTLADGAPRITNDLTSVARRMNDSLAALQKILASENVEAIRRVIQNVENTSIVLESSSGELAVTLRRADNLVRNMDELIEENRSNLDQSLKDVRYTIQSMTRTVDSIVYNLDGAARNMNEFSRMIRQNPGLLLSRSPRKEVSPATSRGDSASIGGGVQ